MKKILIIRTFPSILDPKGYNIQEIGFAKALVKAGLICDVVLYNGKSKDEVQTVDVIENNQKFGEVKIYMRHGFGILKNGFFPGLDKITKNYDILQVHEYDQISSWKYYAWNKKKQVVIYHGPYFDEYNKGYNFKCKIFDRTFLALKNNKNTVCFTKSKAAAKFLNSKGFKHSVPIGVGLNTDNFMNEENSSIETNEKNTWNMVYVGKIEPRRNSLLLLDILEDVSSKREDIRMTVVGTGEKEYLDNWKNKAKPLIDKGILIYIPGMKQAELKDLYRQADIMIFPSNYEIFGMVLLEAMYFDLPVVSSDNGGSDTLINHNENGVIVESFDMGKWSEAILELHDDNTKYLKIKKQLEGADHRIYTWDGIARKYMEELGLDQRGKEE